MSNDIKINVKADADLGGINSALAEAAKSAEVLSKSMSGGVLNIDADKFNQQINNATAKIQVLYEKIQEKKQLGISTDTAEAQLKEFTQKKSDATKVLIGSQPGSGGKTPLEQSHQREQREIEKTQQAAKKLYKEISTAEADAINRAKHNLDTGRNPLAAYSKNHASFSELAEDKTPGAQEAVKHILQRSGSKLASPIDEESKKSGVLPQYMKGLAGAGIGIAAGMASGDAGGGAVSSAGSFVGGAAGALLGSVIPGVGTAIGGFIGSTLGGAAGGVVGGGMEGAQKEAIATSDLRAGMGGLSISFQDLTRDIKTAGLGLGVVSTETAQLAFQFSKTASLAADKTRDIGGEVNNSIGFARGFGIDPSQSNNFFASMRLTGVSKSTDETRKLGLMISESIVKGGNTAKTDEVLGAIQNYTSLVARQSFTTPNAEGFASALATLTRGKHSGMDVQGAASGLSSMDAGLRNGGSEAARIFQFGMYQQAFDPSKTGINILDAESFRQQGAFGTGRKALTSKRDYAKSQGDDATVQRLDSVLKSKDKTIQKNLDTSLIDLTIKNTKDRFQKDGKTDSVMLAKAVSEVTGAPEAFVMQYLGAQGNRQHMNTYKQIGVMPGRNQAMAMQVAGETDKGNLNRLATQFLSGEGIKGKLSAEDRITLSKQTDGKDIEGLRGSLMTLLQKIEVKDEGASLRDTVATVAQAVNNLGSQLLPKVDALKNAMLSMAGVDMKEFERRERGRVEEGITKKLSPFIQAQDAARKDVRAFDNGGHAQLLRDGVAPMDAINEGKRLKNEYAKKKTEREAEEARLRAETTLDEPSVNGEGSEYKTMLRKKQVKPTEYSDKIPAGANGGIASPQVHKVVGEVHVTVNGLPGGPVRTTVQVRPINAPSAAMTQ